jgi:hypothetical protein
LGNGKRKAKDLESDYNISQSEALNLVNISAGEILYLPKQGAFVALPDATKADRDEAGLTCKVNV